jgi:smad nuclear-interacting protein 1
MSHRPPHCSSTTQYKDDHSRLPAGAKRAERDVNESRNTSGDRRFNPSVAGRPSIAPGGECNLQDGDRSSKKQRLQSPPQPDFALSGTLATDTNMFKGRELKWNEPPNIKAPVERWRLYIFKDGVPLENKEPYRLRNTAYMFGRDRAIVDIPTEHPTCSQQHAVLCFRLMHKQKQDENGLSTVTRVINPYIIDLQSVNGTFINGSRVEPSRYVELHATDILTFGTSTREYVLIKET